MLRASLRATSATGMTLLRRRTIVSLATATTASIAVATAAVISNDNAAPNTNSTQTTSSTTPTISTSSSILSALYASLFDTPSTASPPPLYQPQPPADDVPRLRYPVVLVHGFLGFDSLLHHPLTGKPIVILDYFNGVKRLADKNGNIVVVPVLPKSQRISARAKALQIALGMTDTESAADDTPHQLTSARDSGVDDSDDDDGDGGNGQSHHSRVKPTDRDDQSHVQSMSGASNDDGSIDVLSSQSFDVSRYRGKYHLIAHSMGGLDCRYLISHLQPYGTNRIISLHTIGTPHHGSSIADFIVDQVQLKRKVFPIPIFSGPNSETQLFLPSEHNYEPPSNQHNDNPLSSIVSEYSVEDFVKTFSNAFGLDLTGTIDLTRSSAAEFNKKTPNDPRVAYYSYGGWVKLQPYNFFYITSRIIDMIEGANDGLVSIKSAQWGHHVGTVNLDHLEQVGFCIGKRKHLPLFKEILHRCAIIEREEQENITRDKQRKADGTQRKDNDENRMKSNEK